jgi:hypothetical protein
MLGKNIIKIIAPALVAAAVAAPIAQAGTGASDPAGQTEAKGYLGISNYLATRKPVVAQAPDLAGQTEAKGYLGISNYLATRKPVVAQASDLAGQTEAKGYLGISNYLASHGSTEVAAAQTSSFHWGDAAIGAALAAGLFLLGAAGGLFLRRRRVIGHLRH